MVVKQAFEKAGIKPVGVTMGEVELQAALPDDELKDIACRLCVTRSKHQAE
jgi:hypothetical protein